MQKGSFFLKLGVLLLILVFGYSAYLLWQKSNVEADLAASLAEADRAEKKVLTYQNEQITEAISAKEVIGVLQEEDLQWSRIITDIRQTVPRDGRGEPIVEIVSYSGSTDGQLSISLTTVPNSQRLYFDVADLIEAFDDSPNFKDSFVASVSEAVDIDENEVLAFGLTTTYVESNVLDDLDQQDQRQQQSTSRSISR